MSDRPSPASRGVSTTVEAEMVSPYLHNRGSVLYNPVTGASIPRSGEEYRALAAIGKGLPVEASAAALEHLRAARVLN
jgi:hypothetical protein